MEAQRTVMLVRPVVPVGCESPKPSLVVVKWAWLDTAAAQLAVELSGVARTVKVAPEPARSVGPQVRCWVASMEQTGVVFFNDTAATEIYPLSLHDALPI